MTVARTARRVRKQRVMNNAHLSGMGVPRYRMPAKAHVVSIAKKKSKK